MYTWMSEHIGFRFFPPPPPPAPPTCFKVNKPYEKENLAHTELAVQVERNHATGPQSFIQGRALETSNIRFCTIDHMSGIFNIFWK